MSLIKWEPFGEIASMRREFDRLLNRFPGFEGFELQGPSIDVSETESEVLVKADLPGIGEKEIEITVSENLLTIKGERKEEKEEKTEHYHHVERRFGSFQRSIALPAEVDSEKAKAKFEKGVLEIKLPKFEQAKPKKIQIN